MKKVKLYTAKWCPDCGRAKRFLKEKDIEFDEVDIEENPEAVEIIVQARGKRVLPTLEFNGLYIDGNHFNEEKFEEDMKSIGVMVQP